jgi:ABC-type bacteriocin/lantibiotic exporter with double-glycine peptidase domain
MRRRTIIVAVVAAGTLSIGWSQRVPLASRAAAHALGATYLGDSAVIRQRSQEDCGVAALQMVFVDHRRTLTSVDSLRRVVQTRRRGLSFAEMSTLAGGGGLTASGYIMDFDALASTRLPAIAHLQNHFVVVDRVTETAVVIRDPMFGHMRVPKSRFVREWTGRVLVFSKNAQGIPRA